MREPGGAGLEAGLPRDGLLPGFVPLEPASNVQHFGDVVAGAATDTVRLFRDANKNGVDIQSLSAS